MSAELDIRVSTRPSRVKTHPAKADISILLGNDEWPELKTYRLFQRCFVAACSPSFKKAEKIDSHKSLNGQTLIVHENKADAWDLWAKQLGVPAPVPNKLMRFDSMSEIARAAEQGLGVALVSWPLSADWFRNGALTRVFDDEIETDDYFYLAHRPEDEARVEVKNLTDWMLDELKDVA